MRLVTIGVGCISPFVGDLRGNRERLEALIEEARSRGVSLLVTPELGISGYSLADRVLWQTFADRCLEEVLDLAGYCHGLDVLIGTPVRVGAHLYNGMALLSDGAPVGLALKQVLPNYNVFYESRQWTGWPGGATEIHGLPAGDLLFQMPYGLLGVEICEDAWSPRAPSNRLVNHGAEIIANGSASPFAAGKHLRRRRMIRGFLERSVAYYAYANMLGCDSSRLVFDGATLVAGPGGYLVEGPLLAPDPFHLTVATVDLDSLTAQRTANSTWRASTVPDPADPPPRRVTVTRTFRSPPVRSLELSTEPSPFLPAEEPLESTDNQLDEMTDALILGIRDYFLRAGVFRKILLALSGGRDSSLSAILAWHAVKALPGGGDPASLIACRYMPTDQFSKSETRDAAYSLAAELGVPLKEVSIQQEYERAQDACEAMLGPGERIMPVALENTQSRIRAAMMLNWANSVGGLVLVTSNMSEIAVGYFTTGGDNQGGLAPLAGLPKTLVNRLLERAARRWSLSSVAKVMAIPPSAELAEDQRDEDELMPYPILDDILFLYVGERRSLVDVWRLMLGRYPESDPETMRGHVAKLARRLAAHQWKREQMPVGIKVLDLDLDPRAGFRFPVLQSMLDELRALEAAQADT